MSWVHRVSRVQRRALPVVLAVGLAAGLVGAGCGDDSGDGESGDDGTEAVLRTLGEDVVVPSYTELVDGLDRLTAAVDALCGAPSAANLEAARSAWREVAVAYPATRAGGVGPAMDRRLMSDVAYQVRPQQVTELLDGTGPLDVEALADAGAGARGLSAIELLLFDAGSADLAGGGGARRCEYARSASTLAGEAARAVLDDWTGGSGGSGGSGGDAYVATVVSGVDGGPQSSVSALVNEVAHALQTLDDKGLRRFVSAGSLDELAEPYRDGPAAYHMAELRGLLDGVELVVAGPSGDGSDGGSGGGLLALVEQRDPAVAERLDAALADARRAVDALPDSVADTFRAPDQLAAAGDAVAELKVVVGTEVASVLGVTIGFSDADGDS